MTAYGRAQKVTSHGRFSVEVQSVNRKYLEIVLSLPKELWRFDTAIRKWISEKMHRGQVVVKVALAAEQGAQVEVKPNLPLARQVKQAYEEIARELNLPPAVGLELIASVPDILVYGDEFGDDDEVEALLKALFNEALSAASEMKLAEGAVLQKEIHRRLTTLDGQVDKLAGIVEGATGRYREKLKAKIEEALKGPLEEERLLKEVCLFAERVDISEELTRLKSHLQQCESFLSTREEGMGKTIEFLTQELQREVNTIGSKVVDTEAALLVVEMKGEIEKIRQQVQNVE